MRKRPENRFAADPAAQRAAFGKKRLRRPAFFQNKSASRPRGRSKSRTKPKTAQKGPRTPVRKKTPPLLQRTDFTGVLYAKENAAEAQDNASRNRKMAHHALCQAYGAGRSSAIFGRGQPAVFAGRGVRSRRSGHSHSGAFGRMPRPSQGPQACAVPRKDGACIGHVRSVPVAGNTYEIGFSIGDGRVKQGYASEAVRLCVSKPAGRRCAKTQSRNESRLRNPLKAQNGQKAPHLRRRNPAARDPRRPCGVRAFRPRGAWAHPARRRSQPARRPAADARAVRSRRLRRRIRDKQKRRHEKQSRRRGMAVSMWGAAPHPVQGTF